MITTANIRQRLEIIEKVIALYQNEKEALTNLTAIYRDPVYKDIRELESIIDRDQMPHLVKLPTSSQPQASKEPNVKGKAGRPIDKSIYTAGNLKVMYWIFENAVTSNNNKHHEIRIVQTPQFAKALGCGSNTIGKFLNTFKQTGDLKSIGKHGLYAIAPDFYATIEAAYAQATQSEAISK